MMMDSYYRTIKGFLVLIEKEWISFGHKFNERTGHGDSNYKHDQRGELISKIYWGIKKAYQYDVVYTPLFLCLLSTHLQTFVLGPIFLQFMDCVHQLLSQFPTSFQFNANLLIFILDSLYSCQFGNFLYDNEREREEARVTLETPSLWAYILNNIPEFTNVFYRKHDRVLIPNSSRARILFWADYYLRHSHRSRSQYLTEQFHYVPSNEEYQLYFTHPPAAHSRKSRTDPRSSNNNNNHTAEQPTVVTTTPQQQQQQHSSPSPALKAMSPHRTPSRAVATRPPDAPNSHSGSAPLQARAAPPDGDSYSTPAEVRSSSGGSSSTAAPPPQSNNNNNDNNDNNDNDDNLPRTASSLPPSKGSSVNQLAPTDDAPPPPSPQEEKEKEKEKEKEAAIHNNDKDDDDDDDDDGGSRAREAEGESQQSN